MYDIQKSIEFKYSRRKLKDIVRGDIPLDSPIIDSMINAIDEYRSKEYTYDSKNIRVARLDVPSEIIAEELAVIVLQTNGIVPVQGICTNLANEFRYNNPLDGIKTAIEIIAVCEGELYTLYHANDYRNPTETLGLKSNYQPSSNVVKHIDETKFLPPMLVEPQFWTKNNRGGYLLGSGSILLKEKMNHHEENQALDVINILQSIPWELNTAILEFMEVSKKALDTDEKRKNFSRLIQESEEVYKDLLDYGNKFYFVWKYDFRGRSYSQGYHVNPQGNSYRKALVQFSKKELLSETIIK